MFLELLPFLLKINSGFGVIEYLTTRVALTLISSLIISLIFGKFFIKKLQQLQIKQVVREDGPEAHLCKTGTPTMGGILIIFSLITSCLLWADFTNNYFWIAIITAIIFSSIGFTDDYLKILHKNSDGLSKMQKLTLQFIASSLIIYLLIRSGIEVGTLVPFLKDFYLEIGVTGFVILSFMVIIGSSNAVNLTDGLDGLAIMPIVLIASGLAMFAYISSNYNFATHLNMEYLSQTSEMLIICAGLVGSGLGFLWFNAYPAEIFMGDIGSLSLGAILAVVAIVLRQELIFLIMSFIFVIEAISVILQVGYFKYSGGKRLFLMAPIHHHFEKKGISEPKIIVRFWLITLIMVLIAIATIKIR